MLVIQDLVNKSIEIVVIYEAFKKYHKACEQGKLVKSMKPKRSCLKQFNVC